MSFFKRVCRDIEWSAKVHVIMVFGVLGPVITADSIYRISGIELIIGSGMCWIVYRILRGGL